jgi:hypothetical protein
LEALGFESSFQSAPSALARAHAGAESPSLCAVLANRQAGRGTLAMLQGLASSLGSVTSNAVGLARAAGSRVANTPANITSGETQTPYHLPMRMRGTP